jgi:AraC-like DNA-binding protein
VSIRRFATDCLPPSQRLRYWNDIADEIFGGTRVDAEEGSFNGTMLTWQVGQLEMARPSADHSRVRRRRSARTGEYVILHLASRGRGRHRQCGRDIELGPGDFAVSTTEHDYECDFGPHELLVVEFPKAPLLERLPSLEDMLCRRVDGSAPATRMFHDFLLSLWRNGEQCVVETGWHDDVAVVFYDMLALALRHRDAGCFGERHHMLRRRIEAFVESRLADPKLCTQDIAIELGLSGRAVQQMFAVAGTTPSGFILERRLRSAADRLRTQPRASITQVAYETGFNDSGYFGRCFRQRFGAAPRTWRRGALS